jgi:glutathione-specific gamma-glutamylcyclotransferase
MRDAFWVFAYGSLMWRPGFPVVETQPAKIYGYHRAMCIWSHHYRGTPARPGLVLGLDRGGSCHGLVLRVASSRVKAVLAYLHRREMSGGDVYRPQTLRAVLDKGGRRVPAYAFVANRDNKDYAQHMPTSRAASIIKGAAGKTGSNRDYLANTVAHLDQMCLCDRPLRHLLKLVDGPGRHTNPR